MPSTPRRPPTAGSTRCGACPTCRSTPSTWDALVRGRHPRQQPERQRWRGLRDEDRARLRPSASPADRVLQAIQHITEDTGTEINPVIMWDAFQASYLPTEPRMRLGNHEMRSDECPRFPPSPPSSSSTTHPSRCREKATGPSTPSCVRCATVWKRRSTSSTTPSMRWVKAAKPGPSRTSRQRTAMAVCSWESAPTPAPSPPP